MATWTCDGKYPGESLPDKKKREHLYHFTSFDAFVKIWLSKRLLFSNVENVNDIQEADFPINSTNPQQWAVMQKFKDLRLKFRQISLTMDYNSYLKGCMSTQMWAYYGDKGNGVCIILDYDKLNIPKNCLEGKVHYVNCTNAIDIDHNIETTLDIRKFILRNKKKIFFTKQFTWKGENEYRIVSDSEIGIDISDAITAICVSNIHSKNFEFIVRLVGEDVPIYALKFNDTNGKSIPVLDNALDLKKRYDDAVARKNYKLLTKQIDDKIEECKDDDKKSLLMQKILFYD